MSTPPPKPDIAERLPPAARAAYIAARKRAELEEREASSSSGLPLGRVQTPGSLMARAMMGWILKAHGLDAER
jgi:hypothetical protein